MAPECAVGFLHAQGWGGFILIAGLGNRGQSGSVVRTLTFGGEQARVQRREHAVATPQKGPTFCVVRNTSCRSSHGRA